jgi:uncharacterized protein (TIGR02270 family)
MCKSTLEIPAAGAAFAATVGALDAGRAQELGYLFALAEANPGLRAGLLSGFGWVEPDRLPNIVASLIGASNPFLRFFGIGVCSMHRIDPGLTFSRRLEDSDPAVRARAWRMAGELGRRELVSTAAAAAAADEDPTCQFWAAWCAVLLGDRHNALKLLTRITTSPGPFEARAFQLAIQAMSVDGSHSLLQPLARDSKNIRRLIRGAGLTGDPTYVPWLIGLMTDDRIARLAGESFSLITGLDLARLDLELKPPENFESGPNDDPDDPNVDMDEDDGLPWPDQKHIQAWWNANSHRFQPGVRYFMGEPLNRENCLRVLKEGFQRQRIAAAIYLLLLNPGTPLFEWRAPAWRQRRLLETMA